MRESTMGEEQVPSWRKNEEWELGRVFMSESSKRADLMLRAEATDPRRINFGYERAVMEEHSRFVAEREAAIANRTKRDKGFVERRQFIVTLEGIVHDQVRPGDDPEKGRWFGPNAFPIRPSDYDRYKSVLGKNRNNRGMSTIVEWRGKGGTASHFALGVNIDHGPDYAGQLGEIKNQIDEGKLDDITYFHSEHMGFTGRLADVPTVIVDVDPETIKLLANLWMHSERQG